VFTQTESAWENVAKLDQDFFPKEYPSLTIDSFTIIGSGPKNGAGLRLTEERLLSTAGRNPMGAWRRFNEWLATGIEVISMTYKSLSGDPAVWESTIRGFEAQDRIDPPAGNTIVFTGSSSITLWKTLARDMAPLPVINRGFGGSRTADLVRYADRIATAWKPLALVVFVGTNDIAGRKPKTAQQVFDNLVSFIQAVHDSLPEAIIYYLSITPTPARWRLWPVAEEANRLMRDYAETDDRLHFIDLVPAILKPDGLPDRSLYRIDRLHPNTKGYATWAAVLKPILESNFPPSNAGQ